MQFLTRPLTDWPRPQTRDRTKGSYSVTYNKTLNEMERELEHLKVSGDVMIQLDMPEGDIRRDGLPYADKRPRTPRVAVAFTGKYGPMVYRCDVHIDWQQNMRAIVLGMQRLRLVADTGITHQGEQYTGFRALPPAIELGSGAMSLDEAAKFVHAAAAPVVAGIADPACREETRKYDATGIKFDKEAFQTLYRLATRRHHPDAGGDARKWHELQAAADILKKHHGIA